MAYRFPSKRSMGKDHGKSFHILKSSVWSLNHSNRLQQQSQRFDLLETFVKCLHQVYKIVWLIFRFKVAVLRFYQFNTRNWACRLVSNVVISRTENLIRELSTKCAIKMITKNVSVIFDSQWFIDQWLQCKFLPKNCLILSKNFYLMNFISNLSWWFIIKDYMGSLFLLVFLCFICICIYLLKLISSNNFSFKYHLFNRCFDLSRKIQQNVNL